MTLSNKHNFWQFFLFFLISLGPLTSITAQTKVNPLLKCLALEEEKYHKIKVHNSRSKLNIELLNEIAQTSELEIKDEYLSKICAKNEGPGSTTRPAMPISAKARYGWSSIPTARRRVWWAAIAPGATFTPRMSLPKMAASRVFASTKITSRFTTLSGAMPMACSIRRRAVTTASQVLIG